MCDKCCGTCEYGQYTDMDGYVCCNPDSAYLSDFVEYEFCCIDYEEK